MGRVDAGEGRPIFDILVVGGGIHGAAVARDASLRGLSVLLLEASDLASGTSSRSSKLIHGGIRYLETAQFALVREALRERAILLDTAPSFVRPVPFLIPHYKGSGRGVAWITLGLSLYSALARHDRLAEHRRLTRAEALALEPGLSPEGLIGGSLFWDAQMDDALLCVAIAVEASRTGADVRTHTALTKLRPERGGWRAHHKDAIDGSEGDVFARCVVNAAGPWADEVRGLAFGGAPSAIRRTRGTHIVLPGVVAGRALLLTARRDERVFFVLPWGTLRSSARRTTMTARRRGKLLPPRTTSVISWRRRAGSISRSRNSVDRFAHSRVCARLPVGGPETRGGIPANTA